MANNDNLITFEQLQDFAGRADKRLDALEANSPKAQDLILRSDGWTNDSGDENYPYQYKLTIEGVTTASRADAEFDDASLTVATACGVDVRTKTAANAVIFKSFTLPTANLTGTLYITKNAAWSGT